MEHEVSRMPNTSYSVITNFHSLAVSMTTLETVAMVGRLVPWFLKDERA